MQYVTVAHMSTQIIANTISESTRAKEKFNIYHKLSRKSNYDI